MSSLVPAQPVALDKHVGVCRSSSVPALYWWNLPLAMPRLLTLAAEALPGGRLVIHPAPALGAHAAAIGARGWPGETAVVRDVQRFLALCADGDIPPVTAAFFSAAAGEVELARYCSRIPAELEQLPFTVALRPDGDGRARYEGCFRAPGRALAALEEVALGRRFGADPAQQEAELLAALALQPGRAASLRLVLQQGGVRLLREQAGGLRQWILLESGSGEAAIRREPSLAEAVRRRVRESWRRFPVGVVMFAGLPFFIAAFWLASLTRRRK